jgi:hypothetical protein
MPMLLVPQIRWRGSDDLADVMQHAAERFFGHGNSRNGSRDSIYIMPEMSPARLEFLKIAAGASQNSY